jgi:hypothetical protein
VHAEPSHWLHEISMFQNRSSSFFARVPYQGIMYFPNGEQSLSLYRDMAIFFLFFKEKSFNEFRERFLSITFWRYFVNNKKLLGANVPAFISNLGPNNKPKMLKVGP